MGSIHYLAGAIKKDLLKAFDRKLAVIMHRMLIRNNRFYLWRAQVRKV